MDVRLSLDFFHLFLPHQIQSFAWTKKKLEYFFGVGRKVVKVALVYGNENFQLGVRWTIGDVNREGFEALALSICGAWKLFGTAAQYVVYVNTIDVAPARKLTGNLPVAVEWREVSRHQFPEALRVGATVAEGTGWKLCPLRAFDEMPELALDNDCILWEMPEGMERWLGRGEGCLIAEDIRTHFGCFASQCGSEPRNSGIRGIPAGFPYEQLLAGLMDGVERLETEGDEQGLQVAALNAYETPEVVRLEEVTICSPFPPHVQMLGKCGVHFVGLNTRAFNWTYDGRSPVEMTRENWQWMRPEVEGRIFGR